MRIADTDSSVVSIQRSERDVMNHHRLLEFLLMAMVLWAYTRSRQLLSTDLMNYSGQSGRAFVKHLAAFLPTDTSRQPIGR